MYDTNGDGDGHGHGHFDHSSEISLITKLDFSFFVRITLLASNTKNWVGTRY